MHESEHSKKNLLVSNFAFLYIQFLNRPNLPCSNSFVLQHQRECCYKLSLIEENDIDIENDIAISLIGIK